MSVTDTSVTSLSDNFFIFFNADNFCQLTNPVITPGFKLMDCHEKLFEFTILRYKIIDFEPNTIVCNLVWLLICSSIPLLTVDITTKYVTFVKVSKAHPLKSQEPTLPLMLTNHVTSITSLFTEVKFNKCHVLSIKLTNSLVQRVKYAWYTKKNFCHPKDVINVNTPQSALLVLWIYTIRLKI